MDQFIVTIEKPGEPEAVYTVIATQEQVEDLKAASKYAGVVVVPRRPVAVGSVLQWMAGLHNNPED